MSEQFKGICLIVGASHAGTNMAVNLRKQGWSGTIKIIDADRELPYHRPPLSKTYLTTDEGSQHSLLFPESVYTDQEIQLELGVEVSKIQPEQKCIQLKSGEELAYDVLVLATGARALLPPIKGIEQSYVLRTAADANRIRAGIKSTEQKRVIVIGGGYIGLETAASLRQQGAEVTVLEREDRLLKRVTSEEMAHYFMELHDQHGVKIGTSKNVELITKLGDEYLVSCGDGSAYEADFVITGTGIEVNSELAKAAGLEVNSGIVVNQQMQTSDDSIYAIGDCTWHYNEHYGEWMRLESVQNAVDQAKIAAANICGHNERYNSIPWFWSDQYKDKLQMVGLSKNYDNLILRKEEGQSNSFSIWYFKGTKLLAVDAVNNPRAYMLGTKVIKSGIQLDKQKISDVSVPLKPSNFLN